LIAQKKTKQKKRAPTSKPSGLQSAQHRHYLLMVTLMLDPSRTIAIEFSFIKILSIWEGGCPLSGQGGLLIWRE